MGDLDDLAALHAEESFWRYPFGRGWSRAETESFLERTIGRYRDTGMAVSAVVVASTGDLAGWAGLSVPTFLPEILPAVEVGWRLGERHRGRGYATEAGHAWIRYGFEVIGLESIVSIYEPENTASGAVMQRLGFKLDRETVHPERGVRLHVMSLSRTAWQST
jgi:RimJ/RimL family protein N-acetyltransferase